MNRGSRAAAGEGKANLTWRAATAEDEAFLCDVYASSRGEVTPAAAPIPAARRAQIDREFHSRQASYRIDFPGVRFHVLELDGRPVGRCYLQDGPAGLFLVDLILLPAWRGGGLGTALLRGLIAKAASGGRGVRLHVEKANSRAFALYARLGFRIVGDLPLHHLLGHG